MSAEALASGGLALSRYLTSGSLADLAVAVRCVRALPDGAPDRSTLAAGLVMALVRLTRVDDVACMEPMTELIGIADRHPPPGDRWAAARREGRAGALMFDVAHGRRDPRSALAELGDVDAPLDPADVMTGMARHAIRYAVALQSGDLAGLRDLPDMAAVLAGQQLSHPMMAPLQAALNAMRDFAVANEAGDERGRQAAMARVRAAVDGLPPDSDIRRTVDQAFATFDTMDRISAGELPTAGQLAAMRGHAGAAMFDDQRILGLLAAGVAEAGLGAEVPRDRMDSAVAAVRDVVGALPDGHQLTAFAVLTLSMTLMRRYEVFREIDDLAEMADLLETVRVASAAPGEKLWTQAGQMLSFVTDQIGDPAVARDLLVTSLRGYAWNVLLQTDVAAAATAAREAAAEAMDAAERCLLDDAVAQAVTALDAGRGLTLFAATEIRDVTGRLESIGRADLADRWRAATADGAPRLPLDLRRTVLEALAGSDSARLIDPPGVDDIQAALATLDADALVYLVPSRKMRHGAAVVVPVCGAPTWLVLPDLMLGGGHDVDLYLTALAARSASDRDFPAPPTTAGDLRANLDPVCAWAGRTVIGPVLDLVARRAPAPGHRPPRVVLVPMGDLARVPWHAARLPADGRHAVETVAFSYAASARMLCESARRAPVPLSALGLIVGDPDAGGGTADLTAARAEAFAVRQAFYRGARYVGRRPDGTPGPAGAGRRAEIVDWLTSRKPTAGALLHLACHGVTRSDADDASSYLLLADGETLTAEELIGLLADHPDRGIALVVLAACRSGVSTRGYDEAYSLGTTFVAAGARTVLSTQWSIPDGATSLLMFMFHHYLRAEHHPAWDALRRAQKWMLDPGRRPPESMPAQLREHLRTSTPADVLAWAGFVHFGQ